jgi:hypothetical protein
MKRKYLFIALLFWLCETYGQVPIQEAYVSKTYVKVDEDWSVITFSRIIDVWSNRNGQLKISNAEFLKELSGGKANMQEDSAYSTAEFSNQVQTKSKTDKNGLENITYEGKLIFKTREGAYAPNAVIVFIIHHADIIGLKITNKESKKEMAVDLEIKN